MIEQQVALRVINPAVMDEFAQYKTRWEQVTFNTYPEVEDPSFRKIVAMGENALPLILEELREKPSWLFLALEEITGENPVEETGKENLEDIASVWLKWGEKRGHISPAQSIRNE